jgi:hypothetical protein
MADTTERSPPTMQTQPKCQSPEPGSEASIQARSAFSSKPPMASWKDMDRAINVPSVPINAKVGYVLTPSASMTSCAALSTGQSNACLALNSRLVRASSNVTANERTSVELAAKRFNPGTSAMHGSTLGEVKAEQNGTSVFGVAIAQSLANAFHRCLRNHRLGGDLSVIGTRGIFSLQLQLNRAGGFFDRLADRQLLTLHRMPERLNIDLDAVHIVEPQRSVRRYAEHCPQFGFVQSFQSDLDGARLLRNGLGEVLPAAHGFREFRKIDTPAVRIVRGQRRLFGNAMQLAKSVFIEWTQVKFDALFLRENFLVVQHAAFDGTEEFVEADKRTVAVVKTRRYVQRNLLYLNECRFVDALRMRVLRGEGIENNRGKQKH